MRLRTVLTHSLRFIAKPDSVINKHMTRRSNPQLSAPTILSRPEGRIRQYLAALKHSPWALSADEAGRILEVSFLTQELFDRSWIGTPSCFEAAWYLRELDSLFPYADWCLTSYDPNLLSFAQAQIVHHKITLDDLLSLPVLLESSETISRHGMVYTPSSVARWIVERMLSTPEVNGTSVTILDPAVGTGVFLREALRRLAQLKGLPVGGQWVNLSGSFYGIDRDERALRLTRLALLLDSFSVAPKASEWSPPQLILADSLLDQWNKEEKSFDFVIGNPPYRLGRGATIEIEERKKLRAKFGEIITGRVNSYLLFMAEGFSLLSQHGTLSMLVPNAWLGIKEGEGIRSLFLKHGALAEIDVYPQSIFPGTGVEVVSFIAQKKNRSTNLKIRYHLTEDFSRTKESVVPLTQSASKPIALVGDPSLSSLQELLERHSIPLQSNDSPLQARIALQVYAVGRGTPPQTQQIVDTHLFHSASKVDRHCLPYFEGKDVSAFHLAPPSSYLRYGEWMAEHQPISLYTRPRVLVREVLSSRSLRGPIAATCTIPATYNRSVLHIHTRDDSLEVLYALTAILNSSFAALVVTVFGRKSTRKLFPKVVLADLAAFPIPNNFFTDCPQREELARLSQQAQSEQPPCGTSRTTNATLMREIDQLVAAMYQLPYPLLAEATEVVSDRLGMVS